MNSPTQQPDPAPSEDAKTVLRREIRDHLQSMSEDDRHTESVAACSRLIAMDEFIAAGCVMLYMPLASEIDLTSVAVRSYQTGKTVCVPRVDWTRREMSAIEATSFDDNVMDIDDHGLRTPRDGAPVVRRQIDLVVVPGLAFDADGNRLGRGGGFYDRFLPRLRPTARIMALAFDHQIVDTVPHDARDSRVHVIVTDRRIIRASRPQGTRWRHIARDG